MTKYLSFEKQSTVMYDLDDEDAHIIERNKNFWHISSRILGQTEDVDKLQLDWTSIHDHT